MVAPTKATISVPEIVCVAVICEHVAPFAPPASDELKSLVLSAVFEVVSDRSLPSRSLLSIVETFARETEDLEYTRRLFALVRLALESLVDAYALEHDLAAYLRARASAMIDDGHDEIRQTTARSNSFVGVFLRKCALAAEQLSFSVAIDLHRGLKELVCGWELKDTIYDARIGESPQWEFEEDPVPKRTRRLTTARSGGTVAHPDSHTKFMTAWKQGDYSGALEHLSKHFDHTQGRERRSSYQYALLNLALIQADFGCKREALWAIYETIDAARDSKDDACLNLALSWLSDVAMQDPSATTGQTYLHTEDTNRYVISRAHENNLPDVEVLAYLSRRANSTQEAFENVLRAQRVSLEAGRSPSIKQCLATHELWYDANQPSLARATLVQACKHFELQSKGDDDDARLRCRMAMHMWSAGQKDAAVAYLSRDIPGSHFAHVNFTHLIEAQLALFRVLEDSAEPDDLSLILAQGIVGDGLGSTAAVVRYHIRHGDLVLADSIVSKYIGPHIDAGIAMEPHKRRCTYELLRAELWSASSETERALPHVVKAMHCAAKHTLRRQYDEARALLYKVSQRPRR